VIDRVRIALLPLLCAGLAFAPAPFPRPGRATVLDLRAIEGTWRVERLVNFGPSGKVVNTITVWIEIHIEKGRWYFVNNGRGVPTRATNYRLAIDGNRKPATIDFLRDNNAKPWMLGILALDRDRLTVLYKPFGDSRPVAFQPPPAGFYQFTLKRMK
jgi:uncharacterized protein (TIGR03067 family)